MQHIELIKHQLMDLVNHQFVQSLNYTQVRRKFHHNILELRIHLLGKHLQVCNYLRTLWLQDFLDRILEVDLLIPEDLHKYQTYHPYLMQDLLHLQHVDGKNLLHHYTLHRLGTDCNLRVPNYHLKHFHHKHEKMHIQLGYFHPYIQVNLGYLHRKSLL